MQFPDSKEQPSSEGGETIETNGPFGVLADILEGKEVSQDKIDGATPDAVTVPDEVLGEVLRAGMVTLHKELATNLNTFGAICQRAVLAAEADKEQKVVRPIAGLSVLLRAKINGWCKAVDEADKRGLLKVRRRHVKNFAKLYGSLLDPLERMWDARDCDPDSEQAVEALQVVGLMAKVAFKSEGALNREALYESSKLSRKERALIDAAHPGIHKRRAKLRRDAMVAQMGGGPEHMGDEPS